MTRVAGKLRSTPVSGESTEGAGDRERAAEETAGRAGAGELDHQGRPAKKSGERTGSARAGAADGRQGAERAAFAGDRRHEHQRVSLCDARGSQWGAPATDPGLGAAAQALRRENDPSEAAAGGVAGGITGTAAQCQTTGETV